MRPDNAHLTGIRRKLRECEQEFAVDGMKRVATNTKLARFRLIGLPDNTDQRATSFERGPAVGRTHREQRCRNTGLVREPRHFNARFMWRQLYRSLLPIAISHVQS